MKVIEIRIEESTPEGLKSLSKRICELNLRWDGADPAKRLWAIVERMKVEFDGH